MNRSLVPSPSPKKCLEVSSYVDAVIISQSSRGSADAWACSGWVWFEPQQNFMTSCEIPKSGNNKGGSITVPLTFCLTGLESAV
jgi:hypothetical protein